MKFDPNQYETVKERKERFYKDHPNGSIIVKLLNTSNPLDYALFEASVYFDKEQQEKGLPTATGNALEVRDTELSVSNTGKEYESVNYSSWTENAEESAVGRALDNAGYSGNRKPSRDEMQKAQRMNTTMKKYNSKPVSELKSKCPIHNVDMQEFMSKTGSPYFAHREDGDICFGKGYKNKPTTKPSQEDLGDVSDEIPF